MRFSKKRVTKIRKPLIFLSVFNVFEKVGSVFFEKPVFHFKPSEASFSGVMCLASRLLENPKWLLENPKWLLENPKVAVAVAVAFLDPLRVSRALIYRACA